MQRVDVQERPGPSGRRRGLAPPPACTLCEPPLSLSPAAQRHLRKQLLKVAEAVTAACTCPTTCFPLMNASNPQTAAESLKGNTYLASMGTGL